jgi:2-keto-3-deoxy-L-rhamnonate aldolase RhmA
MILKAEIAQRRVTVGPSAEWPVVFALALFDWQIVDTGDAQTHQAILVEFPVLVAVAAEPVAAVVAPLIGKPYGDAVLSKGPDLLDQAVVELTLLFACQEGFDGVATR